MNIQNLRALFPHTAHTKYFNHAATSPLSLPVTDALSTFIHERQESHIDNYMAFATTVSETRDLLASILKVASSRVDLVPNTSYAINMIARGLKWKRGDRIAIPSCEFPANVYPFLPLQELGVEIDFIPNQNGVLKIEDIEQSLKPRTKLLAISWVQFLSGYKAPLKEIGAMCKQKNVLLSVDAIQGFGALDFEGVEAYGIDFLAGGSHKWMMSTQGLGFLYISETVQAQLNPPIAGWLSGPVDWDNFFDYQFEFYPSAERFRFGTMNNLGIAGMNAALKLYQECGISWCNERVLSLADAIRSTLPAFGFELHGTTITENRSGIVTFSHPNYKAINEVLAQNNIIIAERNKLLRFSPTYYNTMSEIESMFDILASLEKEKVVVN